MSKQRPPAIANLIASIERHLPPLVTEYVFDSPGRQRSMRSDRKKNIEKVLIFLVNHCDIASASLLRRVSQIEFMQITNRFVAEQLNISKKTVDRIFSYFISIGILEVTKSQQRVTVPTKNGKWLVFTSSTRKLTDKLWKITGLFNVLIKDRASRILSNSIRSIKRAVAKRFIPNISQQIYQRSSDQILSAKDILEASNFLRC